MKTINLTFNCYLQRLPWNESSANHTGVMRGWKRFVPGNILVWNSSSLSYRSTISNNYTVLDEITKLYSALLCRGIEGVTTSCWCQIPQLLNCILKAWLWKIFIAYVSASKRKWNILFWISSRWLPMNDDNWIPHAQAATPADVKVILGDIVGEDEDETRNRCI